MKSMFAHLSPFKRPVTAPVTHSFVLQPPAPLEGEHHGDSWERKTRGFPFLINVVKTSWMVYTTYKNGDGWGMVYSCFNHITVFVWAPLNLDSFIRQRTQISSGRSQATIVPRFHAKTRATYLYISET